MYSLKFEPLLKSVVRGGDKIVPYKGIESTAKNVGESWELSAVAGNESVVANGEFAGRNIVELIKEHKADLLGAKVYAESGDTFPILVKFIDARDDLSIQVHPDDALAAARHNGSKGKTEMWYVVKADEGAHLMSGMSRQITPEEYVRRIEDNTITDVLCDYKVKEGDVFFCLQVEYTASERAVLSLRSSRHLISLTESMTSVGSVLMASHVNCMWSSQKMRWIIRYLMTTRLHMLQS